MVLSSFPITAAEVFQSFLLAEGPDSGGYIRVGACHRRVDEQMREEPKRTARNISYDEQPIPELSSEAIDFRVASELFTPPTKTDQDGSRNAPLGGPPPDAYAISGPKRKRTRFGVRILPELGSQTQQFARRCTNDL